MKCKILALTLLLAFPFVAQAELTVSPPKLPGLLNSNIAGDDLFLIWDTSASALKRVNTSQLDTRWGGGGGGSVIWGDIGGTITNQSDLTTALNAKQNILSTGNLTSGTTGLSVSGGSGAVIGSGVALTIQTATNSLAGLLSAADHTSFSSAATLTAAATNSNTNSAIVKRDSSGNFSATTITAALSGNASTATALAANPTACSAGSYVTDIAADGTLTCSNPFSGMVESYTGHVKEAEDYTYVLDEYASYAKQITNIRIRCSSGTVTAKLQIGGSDITTCTGISVTSTAATTTCNTGSSNDLAANGRLTLVTSSNSSCLDLTFTVKTARD